MMLALGIGGWVAGLLHLLTHAFFKALLFLGSGSVIYGCHHEQDMRKMGGLRRKMPVTAFTMLIGVLAIVGTPLLSGWYSKDMILSQSLGYGVIHREHFLLLLLPLLTAGLTAFYMFRLWFLTFTGQPRDQHVHDHAKESPKIMTIPLIILAMLSIGVAWGWPLWKVEASYLGELLHKAQPASVETHFASVNHAAEEYHLMAGVLALMMALAGAGVAVAFYLKPVFNPEKLRQQMATVYQWLSNKWYFDELYQRAFVNSTIQLAYACKELDKTDPDRGSSLHAPHAPHDEKVMPSPISTEGSTMKKDASVDGLMNAIGAAIHWAGLKSRKLQSGHLRRYVVVLVLTVVVLFVILSM
jgi:NADH-quinone oxidoreductase subunit L